MSNRGFYFGGVPTDRERQRLRDAYPVSSLVVGRLISYADVASVIDLEGDCPVGSYRYKTVTLAWRREMEALHNVMIGTEKKRGFKVLSAQERVGVAEGDMLGGLRKHRRAMKRGSAVPREELGVEDQRRADHVVHVSAALLTQSRLLTKVRPQEAPQIGGK